MSREYWVMAALALAGVLLVTVGGRPDKPRESLFLFTMDQTVSWPLTIIGAYTGMLESPVRLFPKATDSNFIIAFVFLPAVFVAYYWHYPRDSGRILRAAYTLGVTGAAALIHSAVQQYTDLLVYITFSGYRAWLIWIIVYYLLRNYADWYLGRLAAVRAGKAP